MATNSSKQAVMSGLKYAYDKMSAPLPKAEDWLDDLETVGQYAAEKIGSTIGQTPVVKAMGQVLSNPTPQEVGAQVTGLAKSASNTLQESFGGDPIDVALNYGPGAMASVTPIKTGNLFWDRATKGQAYKIKDVEFRKGGPFGSFYSDGRNGEGFRISDHKIPGYNYKKIDDETFYRVDSNGGYIDFVTNKKTPKQRLEKFEQIMKEKGKDLIEEAGGEGWFKYKISDLIKAEDFLDQ